MYTGPVMETLRDRLQRMVRPKPLAAAGLAAGLMVGVWAWAQHAIEESIRDLTSDSLTALLQSNVEALEMWIETEILEVQSWASAGITKNAVQELESLARANGSSETLLQSPSLEHLRTFLSPALAEPDVFGFLVTNREGQVIAAATDKLVGRRLTPQGQARNAAAFSSGWGIYKPVDGSLLVEDVDTTEAIPVILSAATVLNDAGEPIAALTMFLDPEQDFSRILSVGRLGSTGSTYAFDGNGIMLSELRYEKDLVRLGLVEDKNDAQSTLIVPVRDPGGNLLEGYQPDRDLDEMPLTRAVASAVRGRSRVTLEPYRDYRGVEVVGAWTWLPRHNFGVVTEIEAHQVMNILRPLRLAFWGMFILIALLMAGVFITAYVISIMRQKQKSQRVIGQYTLLEKVGEGGMGKVYCARHALLRRPTAVKLLRSGDLTQELISRFEREVQITSRLTHPNTVEIYDYGRTDSGEFYYVMEYIDGITLADLVERHGPVKPARAVHFLKQVCASLVEAHEEGIIHRDIKPLNVMICKRGGDYDVVKVLDFGLVKNVISDDALELTGKDIVRGTPMYISPERLRDPSIATPASDLYSIGVLAFNLLSGKDPYRGASSLDIAEQALHAEPRRLRDVMDDDCPAELDEIVWKCMQKNPADRPASARELLDSLAAIPLVWTRDDAEQAWITEKFNGNRPPKSDVQF